LFDGENILFDASLVKYINSTNIPPIIIINTIYEHQNLLSLYLVSFLVWLRTYQHPCKRVTLTSKSQGLHFVFLSSRHSKNRVENISIFVFVPLQIRNQQIIFSTKNIQTALPLPPFNATKLRRW
jgi:uncharacterized membrane protein YobD (UPF0266 family)